MPLDEDDCLVTPFVGAVGARTDPLAFSSHDDAGGARQRASLVLVLNGRRELLLRRAHAAGLPHGGAWTCGIEVAVGSGESYAAAATRELRAAFGTRVPPALRYAGKTWLDEPEGRVFIGVFVAAHDAPAPDGAAFVPLHDVMRGLRHAPEAYDSALARAFRLIQGEDHL